MDPKLLSSSRHLAAESSFIKMDRNDATLVGKHCAFDYCNQLDFLPFNCQSCKGTFCLDHRTESDHRCPKQGAWATKRRLDEASRASIGAGKKVVDRVAEKKCEAGACETVIGTALVTGVHCSRCNRDYCIKHRLQEQHDCANVPPVGARPSAVGDVTARTRSVLERFKAWGEAKRRELGVGPIGSNNKGSDGDHNKDGQKADKPSKGSNKNSAATRLLQVNKMKREATGDNKIAPEKRVYLEVMAETESTVAKVPSGYFFYSREFNVGRLLDAAARDLQIENVNNRSDDEKTRLRVYHVEAGRLLDFPEKVDNVLMSGNTVVLLRGVGPPPDLINF